MRAKVVKIFVPPMAVLQHCQAVTDNNIALAFSVVSKDRLELDDILDVDLPNVVQTQSLIRASDGKRIQIGIGINDLHDLNLPMAHGTNRAPSKERMEGGA